MTTINCTLLLLKKGDQILLAMKKRGFGEGRYNGVGGKIQTGETPQQALIRECREEIGVIPMHFWKVAENDFHEFNDGKPQRMFVRVYMCDEWEGEPTESEEMTPHWFNVEDIPYSEMWPDDEFWLPQVLAGKIVVGEFHLNESDAIIQHDIRFVESLPNEG